MLLGATKLLTLLSDKLTWLSAKTHTHSHNIAHSDMPNYKRQELKDFSEVVKGHASKLRSSAVSANASLTIASKDVITTQDEVAKEWEVMRITESSMEYQAGIQLMRKYLAMYKTVLGKMQ